MLSITDFDPKETISDARVHTGTTFGDTGCCIDLQIQILREVLEIVWSPWKWNEKRYGKVSKNKKKPELSERSVRKIDEYVPD